MSGPLDVYVRSFPDGREKPRISADGGLRPVWRRDGTELFYLTPDGDLMAAAIATKPTLAVTKRERLFRAPPDPTYTQVATQYDVAPDGQRFLMIVPNSETTRSVVNVILNWQSLLKK